MMPTLKKISCLVTLFLTILSVSCNNDDLEHKIDALNGQIKNIKKVNNILELKNSLLDKKLSEVLIRKISIDNSTNKTKIDFEDQSSLEVSDGVISNYLIESDNWKVDFTFSDTTSLQTFYLGSTPTIASSDIVLNPFKNAPLTALISIKTPVQGKFQITVTGQDGDKSDMSRMSNDYGYDHKLEVVALYPNYTNQVELKFMNNNGIERYTVAVSIATDKLPAGFPDFSIVKQYDILDPNAFFLADYRPTSIPFMVDAFGKIRWYSTGFSICTKYGLQLLKNGNIGFGRAGVGQGSLFEYTLLGKLIREYTVFPTFQNIHHDVYELPSGNFLVTVDKVGIATVEDHIVELNRSSGAISTVWDLRQILPTTRYTFEKIGNGSDWFHNNAVIYDKSDNSLIVSGQAQGIVKVTWDNQLKWILAPHNGWGSQYTPFLLNQSNQADFDWTWGQHGPYLLPNGNLFVFDNGWGRGFGTVPNQYSRAVEYTITSNQTGIGGTISQNWQYGIERGKDMFAPFISTVDYYPDSDTRLISAGSLEYDLIYQDSLNNYVTPAPNRIETRVIELDNAKNVLFEMTWSSPQIGSTYRTKKAKLN